MALTVAASNFGVAILFLFWFRPNLFGSWQPLDLLALLNGFFFFGGQWFSVKAVKAGDLVVHTSALGIKLFVVAGLSLMIGLEIGSAALVGGVLLAAFAIFLLAGGNLEGWRKHRATVGWTLVGTTSFAISDVLTSRYAQEVGVGRWLCLMLVMSGVSTLILLATRRKKLKEVSWRRPTWLVLGGIAAVMGTQAILINLAFSNYKEPTLSNIVYSVRGLLAIPFVMILQRRLRGVVSPQTAWGALLILGALVLASFG